MIVVANILQPLIDVCDAVLRFFHDDWGFGWGASIIALTVVVRLAILPLTFRQVRGMQQMQRLAPEMKKIQERYKDDKQRQQQELMKFYSEHNFNPLSSCLPLLLQLPFFLSLYYLQQQDKFKDDVRETGKEFLFIPDLTSNAEGWVLVALIVIYIATQLGSSLVTMINVQDKNQRRLMLALPFVFTIVIINFPSGLLVYWITTNVWTVGQQLAIKKFMPAPDPVEGGVGGAPASGSDKPKGRWQGMLDRAAQGAKGDGDASGDGKPARGAGSAKGAGAKGGKAKPASGSSKGSSGGNGGPKKPPPPSPRKKKKRSGRRR